jgi:hypothetical protein
MFLRCHRWLVSIPFFHDHAPLPEFDLDPLLMTVYTPIMPCQSPCDRHFARIAPKGLKLSSLKQYGEKPLLAHIIEGLKNYRAIPPTHRTRLPSTALETIQKADTS